MCMTIILSQSVLVSAQATVHTLAETLKTCDDAAAEPSQLCELSTQACSLLFHQVPSNMPELIVRNREEKEDLIPVSYVDKVSALLVSDQQTHGQRANACICVVHVHTGAPPYLTVYFSSMPAAVQHCRGKAKARYFTACIR